MSMLNALRFCGVEKSGLELKTTYDVLSNREFSLATPFMSNLRNGGNTASCFIIAPEDSLESLMRTMTHAAQISKSGGGVGVFMGFVRAHGSEVNGRKNSAGSVVNWIKILNDIGVAVDQGGKRAGAIKVSLPSWHNDIDKFLDMQLEHGDPRSKAYDVFPNMICHDIFMERVENGGEWVTFCPHEVKQKLGLDVRGKYCEDFNELYLQVEQAAKEGKLEVFTIYPSARELMKRAMRAMFEAGLPDLTFIDEVNRRNPNKGDPLAIGILGPNLCVAPETKILTDKGFIEIGSNVGEKVNVWNGSEWSEVVLKKTGENQPLLKVMTSSGQDLECTPYHKFYVVTDYEGTIIEKRAMELCVGDKLIKLETPVIDGTKELDYAYDNGFFTADGCAYKGDRIYLYGEKIDLKGHLTSVPSWTGDDGRIIGRAYGLQDKFFVPSVEYTVGSRLEWLAGLCDGDGTIARNGTNESIQVCSVNKDFLLEVQLMLQTLGVQSKVTSGREAGDYMLPANDRTGGNKLYSCKEVYRLLITSNGLYKLSQLGLRTHRLKFEVREPQREASQFIKVTGVVNEGRISDTFCFTEPKRNLGVFNGLLTGQCVESYSNVVPDKFSHVCNLGSINMGNIRDLTHLGEVVRMAVRILNAGIELTAHPTEATKAHNDRYRTIGIGLMGVNDWLAKNYTNFYDTEEALKIAECVEWHAAHESALLAQKYGSFGAFEHSEWKNGNMVRYFKENTTGEYDWDEVQALIDKYGMCNSQLTSPAPTTSTSIYQDASPSFLPVFDAYYTEDNKTGVMPVAAKFLKMNPLGYALRQPEYEQTAVIDFTAALQKYTDTGLSMELIFDMNKPEFSAKTVYDTILHAWKKKLKTVYYIRSETVQPSVCVACSG